MCLVNVGGGNLMIDGREIVYSSERDPNKLPWGDLEIDIVLEATGAFASYEKSKVHLEAGAKRVVVSAPIKDDPKEAGVSGATVLMAVNENLLPESEITSNASCTTNAVSPLVDILDETIGIEKALLNTIHAYTMTCLLYTSPSPRDRTRSRMPSSA